MNCPYCGDKIQSTDGLCHRGRCVESHRLHGKSDNYNFDTTHEIHVGKAGSTVNVSDVEDINYTIERLSMIELSEIYEWFRMNIRIQGVFAHAKGSIMFRHMHTMVNFRSPVLITSIDNEAGIQATHFNCLHCKKTWASYDAHKIIAHIIGVKKLWK